MRRWLVFMTSGLLAGSWLGGCAPSGEGDRDRLHALEQRLIALESKPVPMAPTTPPGASLGDVQSLEGRLAALEQRVAALAGVATGDPDAAVGVAGGGEAAEKRLEVRRARRERLREVTDQYRAKLAAIRQQHTDPAARQQAVREALQWYRDERRAVLAGDAPDPAVAP
jgi:hypothetical protein